MENSKLTVWLFCFQIIFGGQSCKMEKKLGRISFDIIILVTSNFFNFRLSTMKACFLFHLDETFSLIVLRLSDRDTHTHTFGLLIMVDIKRPDIIRMMIMTLPFFILINNTNKTNRIGNSIQPETIYIWKRK